MVIYEVNLEIDEEILGQFGKWLKGHIDQMLGVPGFLKAEWFERDPMDPGNRPGKARWTVQYLVESKIALENYFANEATAMRADGVNRFGDKFRARRRILRRINLNSW